MNQPDIIFIVLDTQRADRIGSYGYGRPITPNLDHFAGQSTLFEQAISPAQWTIPSHASMFTGLYPTAHQVTQSDHSLAADGPHLVEALQAAGYQTIGFCNNPLVGILNNGFKRGFHTFYNYGGAFPSLPESSTPLPWPLSHMVESYTQFLRRISYPIQNFFARSDLAFRLSLNAWLTPLWSKYANFKGQNERSVRDVVHFLQQRERNKGGKPLFLFINLMETHLPFWPPAEFIDQVAPYLRSDRQARTILRQWNREAYRWAAPAGGEVDELELRVLNDMYDAEVAYQDDYLGPLFETLERRNNRHNTLTIMVSDHGDGLGEHNYFGHAFVAYQELLHVPLIVNWPGRVLGGKRVGAPVSTRRVYHTMLDAAGPLPEYLPGLNPAEIHTLSLKESVFGRDPEGNTAYSEVYPPLNFVKAVASRQPHLLDRYRCTSLRRAVVKETHKLIHVDGRPDELFDVAADPQELDDLLLAHAEEAAALDQLLHRMVSIVEGQRDRLAAGVALDLEGDESVIQHLRTLGYIE